MIKFKNVFQGEKLKGIFDSIFIKKKIGAAIIALTFMVGIGTGYFLGNHVNGHERVGQFAQGQNVQMKNQQRGPMGQGRQNGQGQSRDQGQNQQGNTNGMSGQGVVDGTSSASVKQ